MKKNLLCLIDPDKMIVFLGMMLVATIPTMAQNTIADTIIDTTKPGIRMIDVDLSVNPRFPILYTDIPDTIFVYEKLIDNTLVLCDKYVYNKTEKRWFSIENTGRPCVEISRRKRGDAMIVNLRPYNRKSKKDERGTPAPTGFLK